MYRVELKAGRRGREGDARTVPNVPCGVESSEPFLRVAAPRDVPNVPCGVESHTNRIQPPPPIIVPNVPCGVESFLNL